MPIDEIVPDPEQPRTEVDRSELEALAASIRGAGVIQPLLVSAHPDPEVRLATPYMIVAGERRWRAARLAGLAAVPVVVHPGELSAADRLSAHGSARWGDPRRLVGRYGLILGQARGGLLRLDQKGHLLTLAPTGGGKGIAAVLPNLLDYAGSVLCTDIKGECYAVSGRFRREALGHTVAALDPFGVAGGGAAYNPLDLVDPASDEAYDHARLIASMLVVP